MTDCTCTPHPEGSMGARMWAALDPREGEPATGQSARAIAIQMAKEEGVPPADLQSAPVDEAPMDSIATLP